MENNHVDKIKEFHCLAHTRAAGFNIQQLRPRYQISRHSSLCGEQASGGTS